MASKVLIVSLVFFSRRTSTEMASKVIKAIRVEAPLLREILAEFLGTFILVVRASPSLSLSPCF